MPHAWGLVSWRDCGYITYDSFPVETEGILYLASPALEPEPSPYFFDSCPGML